jgi:hypothetical protein
MMQKKALSLLIKTTIVLSGQQPGYKKAGGFPFPAFQPDTAMVGFLIQDQLINTYDRYRNFDQT